MEEPKHRQQWTNTLETYVYPVMGSTTVGLIDEPLVLKVLNQEVPEKRRTDGSVAQPGGTLERPP